MYNYFCLRRTNNAIANYTIIFINMLPIAYLVGLTAIYLGLPCIHYAYKSQLLTQIQTHERAITSELNTIYDVYTPYAPAISVYMKNLISMAVSKNMPSSPWNDFFLPGIEMVCFVPYPSRHIIRNATAKIQAESEALYVLLSKSSILSLPECAYVHSYKDADCMNNAMQYTAKMALLFNTLNQYKCE